MMGNIEEYVPSALGAKGRRHTSAWKKGRKGAPDRRAGMYKSTEACKSTWEKAFWSSAV